MATVNGPPPFFRRSIRKHTPVQFWMEVKWWPLGLSQLQQVIDNAPCQHIFLIELFVPNIR
jgi:hypothetical protein